MSEPGGRRTPVVHPHAADGVEPPEESDRVLPSILIVAEDVVPIYQQLAQQLLFQITTGQMAEGERLPSVRDLATRLGVNAGTVAQAYRELQAAGLLEGRQGHGTYVRSWREGGEAAAGGDRKRFERLDTVLARAIEMGRAMGFETAAMRQRMHHLLGQRSIKQEVVLIGPSALMAEKYALIIERGLQRDDLQILPFPVRAVREGLPQLEQALQRCYFIITFRLLSPQVEQLLGERLGAFDLIRLAPEMTEATMASLAALDPVGDHLLVTEARNQHTVLSILKEHSPLDYRRLRHISEQHLEQLGRGLPPGTKVLYTLGMREALDHADVPLRQRVEIAFGLGKEALQRLANALAPESTAWLVH